MFKCKVDHKIIFEYKTILLGFNSFMRTLLFQIEFFFSFKLFIENQLKRDVETIYLGIEIKY